MKNQKKSINNCLFSYAYIQVLKLLDYKQIIPKSVGLLYTLLTLVCFIGIFVQNACHLFYLLCRCKRNTPPILLTRTHCYDV